jgi:hypothetical protein
MKNNNFLKIFTISILATAILTAGFTYLRQQPNEFLAQLKPWTPTDKDKIGMINEFAFDSNVGVDTTYKTYADYYAKELTYYLQNSPSLPSLTQAKKFRSSLSDYRLTLSQSSSLAKPSYYTCAFNHLDVDTMIECYLLSRGMPQEPEKYVTRLKRADSSKYAQIVKAREKLNNWAYWVRNNWEPTVVKNVR